MREITTAYHLLDDRNWESIKALGLMSAQRLAAASGHSLRALRKHRPSALCLSSGAVIRDQSPMPPKVLAGCLRDGLKPDDWYDLINSKVFFWLDPERLNRQRRVCGAAPQRVIVVDACRMLDKHGCRAAVTPINTGNAMRAAASRGLSTFVPWPRWTLEAWASENPGHSPARAPAHRPVELTIQDEVEDIFEYARTIIALGPGQILSRDGRIALEA